MLGQQFLKSIFMLKGVALFELIGPFMLILLMQHPDNIINDDRVMSVILLFITYSFC
ncbi:conserved membrane hypothetical protein [Sulfurovum sp. enrichment culture clone C5]|uniref:Uncharacterized protein n=1 Tax=Sulfurovum sp. enrichment culture clone C5 TaxID=497650 RepID=A0A0S4XPL1_9BACT|nr:conserved membrane hypothetical protein [Sulfurovum sp. enrichment culture clone C5]